MAVSQFDYRCDLWQGLCGDVIFRMKTSQFKHICNSSTKRHQECLLLKAEYAKKKKKNLSIFPMLCVMVWLFFLINKIYGSETAYCPQTFWTTLVWRYFYLFQQVIYGTSLICFKGTHQTQTKWCSSVIFKNRLPEEIILKNAWKHVFCNR